MSVQEQAVQMIRDLSEDNVIYLIDFMKRFMIPDDVSRKHALIADETDFMQEMEHMRIQAKPYFPSEFDSRKIWEEAMDEKYDYIS